MPTMALSFAAEAIAEKIVGAASAAKETSLLRG